MNSKPSTPCANTGNLSRDTSIKDDVNQDRLGSQQGGVTQANESFFSLSQFRLGQTAVATFADWPWGPGPGGGALLLARLPKVALTHSSEPQVTFVPVSSPALTFKIETIGSIHQPSLISSPVATFVSLSVGLVVATRKGYSLGR